MSACSLPNNYYCTYSPSIFHHQNQHTMKIVELNNDMCHFTIFVMMQYIQLVYLPYPTISHKQKAVAAARENRWQVFFGFARLILHAF